MTLDVRDAQHGREIARALRVAYPDDSVVLLD
jgi:hypothetical protein